MNLVKVVGPHALRGRVKTIISQSDGFAILNGNIRLPINFLRPLTPKETKRFIKYQKSLSGSPTPKPQPVQRKSDSDNRVYDYITPDGIRVITPRYYKGLKYDLARGIYVSIIPKNYPPPVSLVAESKSSENS